MRSNLSSGFLKLFSIQTGGAFPPFLSTLPHKTSRWWSSQSWPEHLVPSSGYSVLSHTPNTTNWRLLPHHYAQDMVGRECVSNIDLHDIKSNVFVKDQGTQERNPSRICHSSTGAQLLLVFISNCWLNTALCFLSCVYPQKNKELAFKINWKQRFHTTKLGWLVLCGAQISAVGIRIDKGKLWSLEQAKAADS